MSQEAKLARIPNGATLRHYSSRHLLKSEAMIKAWLALLKVLDNNGNCRGSITMVYGPEILKEHA